MLKEEKEKSETKSSLSPFYLSPFYHVRLLKSRKALHVKRQTNTKGGK
ncbi:MAG: hypothetical protein JXK50_06685 [Campylobacterales bacterium]|nr:hypothetical protein [Campylobacterales bacterium]